MKRREPWLRVIGSTTSGTLIAEMTPDYLSSLGSRSVKTLENLGQLVTAYCYEHGMSYTEFARRAGLSRNRLSLLVNGHRPNITSGNAEKILKVLNTAPGGAEKGE